MSKVLYYKGKQSIVLQKWTKMLWPKIVLQKKVTKVLYYKSKQRCYGQSIVLQK